MHVAWTLCKHCVICGTKFRCIRPGSFTSLLHSYTWVLVCTQQIWRMVYITWQLQGFRKRLVSEVLSCSFKTSAPLNLYLLVISFPAIVLGPITWRQSCRPLTRCCFRRDLIGGVLLCWQMLGVISKASYFLLALPETGSVCIHLIRKDPEQCRILPKSAIT